MKFEWQIRCLSCGSRIDLSGDDCRRDTNEGQQYPGFQKIYITCYADAESMALYVTFDSKLEKLVLYILKKFQYLVPGLLFVFSLPAMAAGEAPSKPLNLSGDLSDSTVSLDWEDSTDADDTVQGYNVYLNDAYITTVFDSAYVGQVEPDTSNSFYIVAFDEAPRLFSPASETVTLPDAPDPTSPPTAPSSLSATIEGSVVTLQWSAPTGDEAVLGYNVYQDDQYLTTVGEPTYSGAIDESATTSFYVVAFDIRRNFSQRSDSISLPGGDPVTALRPEPPDGLTGDVQAGDSLDTVTLRWNQAVAASAVAGYNVYINDQYVATTSTTEFQGTVDAGSSNAFSVVTFDSDGKFSVSSVSLILPIGPGIDDPGVSPSSPTELSGTTEIENGQATVALTWEPSSSADNVTGYNVYRDNDYLTTVKTAMFTDTVAAESAVSYAVVAFDKFGNYSVLSEPLSLLGSARQPPSFSNLNDQNLRVGELFELKLSPMDVDGNPAGIEVGTLPAGMENIDKQDETRSLRWSPASTDVGSFDIAVTAFDLTDVQLRTTETFTLTVSDDATTPVQGSFELLIEQTAYELTEGDADGVEIPISLTRSSGFDGAVELSATVDSGVDASLTRVNFSKSKLEAGETRSTLKLTLDIDVLPIQSRQGRITISASDVSTTDTVSVTVDVSPVQRDDIYLLIGQSNMVGTSENGAKRAGAGQPDALNQRIRQLNVAANDESIFARPSDFSSPSVNVADPRFILAEDPLHDPINRDSMSKEGSSIGLGLSFAKQALKDTTQNIVLVPAAWGGTGFCDNGNVDAQWNATTPTNSLLGNTQLFDRALIRVNTAIAETGGILRGILWLQGEHDRKSNCAASYEENLVGMVKALRSRIDEDARGSNARKENASIPFVTGTLSVGVDPRGDFSKANDNARLVNSAIRSISSLVPFAEVSLHDDLVPANDYPCGRGSCIHFGGDALREMGKRYYDALRRASDTP